MKSDIKFETHKSDESVNFLDVKVSIINGQFVTSDYSKPTDAHLFLHPKSCHPPHVIRNIPKGQFIRIRRICSKIEDFLTYGKSLSVFFTKRGYKDQTIDKIFNEVKKMDRESLLTENERSPADPQSILVTTWHPELSQLPSVLHSNYHILKQDHRLSKVFKSTPRVAFRRKKTISNFLVKNNTNKKNPNDSVSTHCSCNTCRILNLKSKIITNPKNGFSVNAVNNISCKSRGVIYVAKCKVHGDIYVGLTGDTISKRLSNHRYDAKNRPDNNELAAHFHQNHNFDTDLEVQIAHKDIYNEGYRKFLEDRTMCKLQSKKPNGLNTDCGYYAKEMYSSWRTILEQHVE